MSELLTVNEVARRLRLHHMTVRRQIRSGRLRAVRVGRGIRVREEDMEAFMEPEVRKEEEMSVDELRMWAYRMPTPAELAERRKLGKEMKRLRARSAPLGMSTATLVRVARRSHEVLYGEKTWEELIGEES